MAIKGIKAEKGISVIVGKGGDDVTDVMNGYAVLKEKQLAATGQGLNRATVFNKDRLKLISYTYTHPGGGANRLLVAQANPDNITNVTNVSSIDLDFGQNYMSTIPLQDRVTVAADDSLLLLSGVNNNTNIFRVVINPGTYQITDVVAFDTGIASPKKVEIIATDTYINYTGQTLQIFAYDGTVITLGKTVQLGFDIVRLNAVNGLIVVIGLNRIVVVDPIAGDILYTETTASPLTLSDVFSLDDYALVKTLSSVETPVLGYKITSDKTVTKLPLSVAGEILSGGVKSLVNVIKDDTAPAGQYIMSYHSDNVSNMMLHIDLISYKVKNIEVGADVVTGAPATTKPLFFAGNRILYNSSTAGTPSTNYITVYKYEYTEISHRKNGKLFKIKGLG